MLSIYRSLLGSNRARLPPQAVLAGARRYTSAQNTSECTHVDLDYSTSMPTCQKAYSMQQAPVTALSGVISCLKKLGCSSRYLDQGERRARRRARALSWRESQ